MCMNKNFLHIAIHLIAFLWSGGGVIISHPDSRAFRKVFLSMDGY